MAVDLQRFWNRSLPQTLQTALIILYIRAFFLVIDMLDTVGVPNVGTYQLLTLVAIGLHVGGGYLMANERKIGYLLAIGAAFTPFVRNYWVFRSTGLNIFQKLAGGFLSDFNVMLGMLFTIGLIALLLHPMSKDYQRIWFR